MALRVIKSMPSERSLRPETGVLQFDGDWAGVFIRGDNAHYYAMTLEDYLNQNPSRSPIQENLLRDLVKLLRESDERTLAPYQAQRLKAWPECQKP